MGTLMTVTIDGRLGEGGGQILRSSLALSMITGRPLRIHHIRGGRRKPGLLRQHLTGLRAAAEICGAQVSGDHLGSDTLSFDPGPITAGDYRFAVGSAGSCALVLQTVLPALWMADGPSSIEVEGGTHAMSAPPAPFLQSSFAPLARKMGAPVEFELGAYGFFPAGGGRISAVVEPATWVPLDLMDRGEVSEYRPVSVVANLSTRIARREISTICRGLGLPPTTGEVRSVESEGPGNAAWVEIIAEHVTAVFSETGRKGLRAEDVARSVVEQSKSWLEGSVAVGPHLADQLLLPMAIGAGGAFRTGPLSLHSRTNIEVIQRFLACEIHVEEQAQAVTVIVSPPAP